MQIVNRGAGTEFFWEIPDLCEAFDRDPRTIRRWVEQGRLPEPSIRNGRKVWEGRELEDHYWKLYRNSQLSADFNNTVYLHQDRMWKEAIAQSARERQSGWHHADAVFR